jgi:phage-related protein
MRTASAFCSAVNFRRFLLGMSDILAHSARSGVSEVPREGHTSRPMPSIGTGCYELRVRDEGKQCRLIYRLDADAILVLDLFRKTTQKTPKPAIDRCRRRLRQYDDDRA